jgi:hypothetical protein
MRYPHAARRRAPRGPSRSTRLLASCVALLAGAAAGANTPPTVSGRPPLAIVPGQYYCFRPAAADADRNPLSFSVANRPAWLWFDARSGTLAGVAPTAVRPGTTYAGIVIRVSDGRVTRSLAPFSIKVEAATMTLGGTPPGTAQVGATYRFRPTLKAPAGATVAFSIRNKPAWASFSTATGEMWGRPAGVATHREITISASTGARTVAMPPFVLTVAAAAATRPADTPLPAESGGASIVWHAPQSRLDGRPLLDLAGYRLRYGVSPQALGRVVQIANPGATAHTLTDLSPGTWYFAVTAYTTAGVESALSAVIPATIR